MGTGCAAERTVAVGITGQRLDADVGVEEGVDHGRSLLAGGVRDHDYRSRSRHVCAEDVLILIT